MYILKIDGFGMGGKKYETLDEAFHSAQDIFYGPYIENCRYVEIRVAETDKVVGIVNNYTGR